MRGVHDMRGIKYEDNEPTLRDYFASSALIGLLSDGNGVGNPESISIISYKFADEMLKAREK